MRVKLYLVAVLAVGLLAPSPVYTARAQAPARTVWNGVYTTEQANRGMALYNARCASCHGAGLEGADVSPPLSGPRFAATWRGQTVGALGSRIRTTMPLDDPGSLGVAATADITAYILRANQYPAGATALPRQAQAQQQIRITTR